MKNVRLIQRIENIQNKAKYIISKIELLKKSNDKKFNSVKDVILNNEKQILENIKIIEEQSLIIAELNELKENRFEGFTTELLSEMNYDSILELTKNKEIAFDKNHPYINNLKFIKDLMDYFIEIEEYEECANLQKNCLV